MKNRITARIVAGVLASALLGGGCTQMPTEKQSVSDMRPQISFRADGERAQTARVFVDGLDMGMVSEYLDGQAALRVLSGNHKISVTAGGSVLLEEKAYLGDGVSRSFIVK
ncbi:MAG: hypothetical protein Q8O52_06285 [Sulfuritalea sp.]|nr:hypothetical protein [Sulfuritalea sp.]